MAQSRRLRKKLYKGEFAQRGFSFVFVKENFKYDKSNALDAVCNLIDDFCDVMEANGLETCMSTHGPAGDKVAGDGLVMLANRYGGPSDEQIQSLANWLTEQEFKFKFSPVYDLNYEWDDYENWERETTIE